MAKELFLLTLDAIIDATNLDPCEDIDEPMYYTHDLGDSGACSGSGVSVLGGSSGSGISLPGGSSGSGVSLLEGPPLGHGPRVDFPDFTAGLLLVPAEVPRAIALAELIGSREVVHASRISLAHRYNVDADTAWVGLQVWQASRINPPHAQNRRGHQSFSVEPQSDHTKSQSDHPKRF